MPITPEDPFHWRHYEADTILTCVRWYLDLPLSYRHAAKLIRERGWTIHPSCVFRWVQVYAPEVNKRCRPDLRSTNKSYRVDETYIKVKGKMKYLDRAVDSMGQTIDFLLTAKRDASSAKRFFRQAFKTVSNPSPRVINVNKNAAYPVVVRELKTEGIPPKRTRLRQCRYINNMVEQNHRFVKRRTRLAMRYGSFWTAWRTLQGIEAMPMINKGRVRWLTKNDVIGQTKFFQRLFTIHT